MVNVPLAAATDSVLHDLCIHDPTRALEERLQLLGPEAGCELLHEDGAPITLIISRLWATLPSVRVRGTTVVTPRLIPIAIATWAPVAVVTPVAITPVVAARAVVVVTA